MVVLATTKKILIILGILPVSEVELLQKLLKYQWIINKMNILLYVSLLILGNFSVLFYFLFRASATGEYFETGLVFVLFTLRLTLYVTLHVKKTELIAILGDFEDFFEKSKKNFLKRIFAK